MNMTNLSWIAEELLKEYSLGIIDSTISYKVANDCFTLQLKTKNVKELYKEEHSVILKRNVPSSWN